MKFAPVKLGWPKTKQEEIFCREYLKSYNAMAAAKIAKIYGRTTSNNAYKLVARFSPYLQYLQAEKTQAVAKKIVYDQESILQALARVMDHDPRDFEEEVTVGRRKVRRMKPLSKLTREQALLVADIWQEGGEVKYRLESRARARQMLGKHLGLFHDKLIAEHRHAHLHAAVDLSHVSNEQLATLEGELLRILGPQADRILGYTYSAEEEK